MKPLLRHLRRPISLPSLLAKISILGLAILPPWSTAAGCFEAPGRSLTVSVSLSAGDTTGLRISYWDGNEATGQKATCTALASVKLSTFPTARVATRPGDVAAAVREVADLWEVSECQVTVVFENDTKEDLAAHEMCWTGLFRFDKGDFWSSSSESTCWEPADETT